MKIIMFYSAHIDVIDVKFLLKFQLCSVALLAFYSSKGDPLGTKGLKVMLTPYVL